jgi:hypothetical protein
MAFPGPNAEVFYNEAGEPLGWDNHYYDEPPDVDEFYDYIDDSEFEDEDEDAEYSEDVLDLPRRS